jgi:hypothetical protein
MAQTMMLSFFAPVFFGPVSATLVMVGLILGTLAVLGLSGILLDRVVLPGERIGFIMELPLYHRPNFRTVGVYVWQRAKQFLTRAGTVILAVAVAIWALSYLPNGEVETSILAAIGHALTPLGNLMGLNWRMLVALFTSFVSKEAALATMAVLLGAADTEAGLAMALQAAITPAAALGFLVTQMLFVPCLATDRRRIQVVEVGALHRGLPVRHRICPGHPGLPGRSTGDVRQPGAEATVATGGGGWRTLVRHPRQPIGREQESAGADAARPGADGVHCAGGRGV